MQHEDVARAAHGGDRRADHAGERRIGLLVDAHDLSHGQPLRVDAVEPVRHELVARDDIGADRYEAQLERIAGGRAVDDAAQARAHDLDRHGLIFVRQQRDFRLHREDARDLADHPVFADDGRAVLDPLLRAAPDDDLLRKGIAHAVLHLGRYRLRRDVARQIEQRTQMPIFSGEGRDLIRLQRKLQVLGRERLVLAPQRVVRHGELGCAERKVARQQRDALQRIEPRVEHGAHDFERLEARVGDEQHQ